MSETDALDPPSEDVLRMLVSTDNHLGYLERDPLRGEDSFNSFEEMLQYAKELQVDMILLGGDLFHDNKPSRHTLFRTMELLRTYCMGDEPISVEILSDQKVNFHSGKFNRVNYEDPNYNVGIPVFSVHGNHDDPAGEGSLSALDLLSVTNLINYFGKSDNIDDVSMQPILLRKGSTRVALYGLGHIRDERLYRTFEQKKVRLLRPIESPDEWFSILVLHQNRVAHSTKNYVDERVLGDFLDFIVWGHEHDCRIIPEPSSVGNFHISQPGSSVATSLSEGEAKPKYVGLLEICGEDFRLQPLPLKTVRPFLIEEVCLSEQDLDPAEPSQIVQFLASKVESMIEEAMKDTSRTAKTPDKPLIRLKVEYTGFSTCNPQRFGQQFVGKVANPNEILLFYRRRRTNVTTAARGLREEDIMLQACRTESLDDTCIEDLVSSFLGVDNRLEILPEEGFNLALKTYVEKDEKQAIQQFVSSTLKHTQGHLRTEDPSRTIQPDYIKEIVSELRSESLPKESPLTHRYENESDDDDDNTSQKSVVSYETKASKKVRKQPTLKGTLQKGKTKTKTGLKLSIVKTEPSTPPKRKRSSRLHATEEIKNFGIIENTSKRKTINALTDAFSVPVGDKDKEETSLRGRWGKRKKNKT